VIGGKSKPSAGAAGLAASFYFDNSEFAFVQIHQNSTQFSVSGFEI
jgi:hypothetical protein